MSQIFGPPCSVPLLPKVAPAPVCDPSEHEGEVTAAVATSFSVQCLFQRFVVKPIARKHVLELEERTYHDGPAI